VFSETPSPSHIPNAGAQLIFKLKQLYSFLKMRNLRGDLSPSLPAGFKITLSCGTNSKGGPSSTTGDHPTLQRKLVFMFNIKALQKRRLHSQYVHIRHVSE